ncbi:MAG: Hsp20/alpha crystallin family protein [Planctomycetota bacterium]
MANQQNETIDCCKIDSHATSEPRSKTATRFSPRFDLVRSDESLELFGDMPGVDQENLTIEIVNGHLTIAGKVERRLDGPWLRQEYGVGDFHRSFRLGDDIDIDQISANLQDGVLHLTLPIAERAKPRKIEVSVN